MVLKGLRGCKKPKEDRKRGKEVILNKRREWLSGIVGESFSKSVKRKRLNLSSGSTSAIF